MCQQRNRTHFDPRRHGRTLAAMVIRADPARRNPLHIAKVFRPADVPPGL